MITITGASIVSGLVIYLVAYAIIHGLADKAGDLMDWMGEEKPPLSVRIAERYKKDKYGYNIWAVILLIAGFFILLPYLIG